MKTRLSVKIGKLTMQDPFMNAAGTAEMSSTDEAELAQVRRWGAYVQKSTMMNSRDGNDQPRIQETVAGMINRIGLQGVGVRKLVSEKIPAIRLVLGDDVKFVVGIAGETIEEYGEIAKILAEGAAGKIDAVEVNISCPNIKTGGMLFACDPKATYQITRAVKSELDVPIWVKLTPNVTDIIPPAQAAASGGADAISLINTVRAAAYITRGLQAGEWILGGLSGPCIKPIALYLVLQVSRAVDLPIIAMGGISNLQDALDFLLIPNVWGVAIGTASFADPAIISRLVKELEDYMIAKNYSTIAELKEKEMRR